MSSETAERDVTLTMYYHCSEKECDAECNVEITGTSTDDCDFDINQCPECNREITVEDFDNLNEKFWQKQLSYEEDRAEAIYEDMKDRDYE